MRRSSGNDQSLVTSLKSVGPGERPKWGIKGNYTMKNEMLNIYLSLFWKERLKLSIYYEHDWPTQKYPVFGTETLRPSVQTKLVNYSMRMEELLKKINVKGKVQRRRD